MSPIAVYAVATLVATIVILPLAPFIHRAHTALAFFLALIFIGTTAYNLLAFPFSSSEPLKVFFKQTLDLDSGSNTVYLEGIQPFLLQGIIPELPSASDGATLCSYESIRVDLFSCHWHGLAPDVVPSTDITSSLTKPEAKAEQKAPLLTVTTNRTTPSSASFTIKARDTRACRIFFDDEPVRSVFVHGSSGPYKVGKGEEGVKQIRLWSRTWEREFLVDVEFASEGGAVKGRVACEWSELIDGRIPALEEIITFLPTWAAVTKADDGLVEGFKAFEI